ncbi:DNA repair protein reco [Heliomicrobium modesticaldum Ice1]|uniref:DNA repair protein RecO n=1 Tax=Heliobacterium modesticaldum (strain ATCC 51547 / Ice1) TaxID=498761 RepID=RECO_HELMI|nr:DNA repair protein RecO [Heliomicrobium modesticaldum]B0TAF3.1 RecName: Full=DNA repair protein RecO; AltName: Full=Recombination protein O [Heliomicrobium modesticaldum Ice1]ABZ85003.1 DNA repair protein reco [Heliomicrobium modesticaldum Ice1]
MRLYRAQALVLRSRSYGEADRLLTLLTRERGKLSAIAKGVRKPTSRLRAGTQPLTHSQLVLYEGKNLQTVTQAEPVESFAALHGDVVRFSHASSMAELVDRLSPDHSGADLFPLLLTGWHLLSVFPGDLVACLFQLRLLDRLGYCPELSLCLDCGEPVEIADSGPWPAYSPEMGGLVGNCCRHRHSEMGLIAPGALALLRHLLQMDPRDLGRLRVGPKLLRHVSAVLKETIRCRSEGNMRSWSVIESVGRSLTEEPELKAEQTEAEKESQRPR